MNDFKKFFFFVKINRVAEYNDTVTLKSGPQSPKKPKCFICLNEISSEILKFFISS